MAAGEPDPRVTLPAGIPTGIPTGNPYGPAPVSSLIPHQVPLVLDPVHYTLKASSKQSQRYLSVYKTPDNIAGHWLGQTPTVSVIGRV